MLCNICASLVLTDFNGRQHAQCARCGSFERHRILRNYLCSTKGHSPLAHAAGGRVYLGVESESCAEYFGFGAQEKKYFDGVLIKTPKEISERDFSHGSFDLVIFSHVLDKLHGNPLSLFAGAVSSLISGGVLVFTAPLQFDGGDRAYGESVEDVIERFDSIRNSGISYYDLEEISTRLKRRLLRFAPDKKIAQQFSFGVDSLYYVM